MASQITDQIWLGNSSDARALHNNVDAVLNCANDLANVNQWDRVHVAQCGLIDGPGNHMSAYLSAVFQLDNLVRMGKRVLVHCHEGKSLSAAVILMYLHGKEPLGWDSWLAIMKAKREIVNVHEAHAMAFGHVDWTFMRAMLTRE